MDDRLLAVDDLFEEVEKQVELLRTQCETLKAENEQLRAHILHERNHQEEYKAHYLWCLGEYEKAKWLEQEPPKLVMDFLFRVRDLVRLQHRHPNIRFSLYHLVPTSCEEVNCPYKSHQMEIHDSYKIQDNDKLLLPKEEQVTPLE